MGMVGGGKKSLNTQSCSIFSAICMQGMKAASLIPFVGYRRAVHAMDRNVNLIEKISGENNLEWQGEGNELEYSPLPYSLSDLEAGDE